MRKPWLIGGVAAIIIAVVAFAVWSRATGGVDKSAKPPEVALEFSPREVVQPLRVAMPQRIEFSGPLVAPGTAIVRAKAAGTLLALSVGEGSRVRAGQSLGVIDLAEMHTRVTDRVANVDSAQAGLSEAERQHAANVAMAAQNFISPTALQSSQAKLDAARAQLQSMQAQLSTTRLSVKEAALTAPISGVVSKRHVVPGEKLSMEQPVVTIVDLARLELAASVGTHEVSRLAPGMAVEVHVEGLQQSVAGQLARIAPAAEPGTRSIGVTITIDNPKEAYRAGQYALAAVVLPDAEQRLTVPLAAIGNTSGQNHVWVIDNGALARRAISTGRRDETQGRIEVLSGLAPTAQVLAARFDNLREGAKATVAARAAPVASAAASTTAR